MIGRIATPRLLLLLLAWLTISFAPSSAIADGKVFRSALAEPPPIPDQQALICYNPVTQVQTLAIETRFQLSATSPKDPAKLAPDSYAWVVPIPGPEAPIITPGTTGFFPTLRVIFQPRVRDMRGPEYAYPVLLAVGVILVLVRMTERGTAFVGVLLAGLLALLSAMVLLPALGTARSSASAQVVGVDVLNRSIVGDYQVTTIAAAGDAKDSAAVLSAWLDANGFKQPPSVAPVLADYARRNWVFACVKLLQLPKPSDDGTLTPRPLVFTFKTPEAVYPMALTGVGNGPLKLDLYVFGSGTAQVPGMKLVRSDAAVPASDSGQHLAWRRSPDVLIAHPELVRCVGKLPIATKLSGTLRPDQQAQDLPITFSDFIQTGSIVYSRDAAVMRGIDVASAALLAGTVLLVVITAFMRQNAAWFYRRLPILAAVAIVAGFSMWVATPAVKSTSLSRRAVYGASDAMERLRDTLADASLDWRAAPKLDDARLVAQRFIASSKINAKEEDSPGNYTLTLGEHGEIDFIWYDAVGAPQRSRIWPAPDRPAR